MVVARRWPWPKKDSYAHADLDRNARNPHTRRHPYRDGGCHCYCHNHAYSYAVSPWDGYFYYDTHTDRDRDIHQYADAHSHRRTDSY
jgi:hypothetical protein